ncbi:hypothetical protein STCU_03865 [Strigomonas culicis]|uniref:Uncharacterized protein n=1 Tax=Strigomonas culicis TaxID=28005 RepID=S9UPL2_9TRYP|nr:hypothetical protein STCU_03865 [Strigomonas culicis]|eukprot:EPY30838.1 hypothetical protein STCU_03865 [Strigomonas culicis]
MSPSVDAAAEAELLKQSKEFLVRRVMALERQLKIRNADCARLLQERHQLLPLKEKCESQKEMILALKDQVHLLQVEKGSALESLEAMRREQRDAEHQQRMKKVEQVVGPRPAAASAGGSSTYTAPQLQRQGVRILSVQDASPPPPSRPPGGTVVNTSVGPQILYDSSDISSVGFAKQTRPMDFLGGAGAANTLAPATHPGPGHAGAVDAAEEADVRRLMAMAKEGAELDVKYAGIQDEEERALRARIDALKTRK